MDEPVSMVLEPKTPVLELFGSIISLGLLAIVLNFIIRYSTNFMQFLQDIYMQYIDNFYILFKLILALLVLIILYLLISAYIATLINSLTSIWITIQGLPRITISKNGIQLDSDAYTWDQIGSYTTVDKTIILNFQDYTVPGIVKFPMFAYKIKQLEPIGRIHEDGILKTVEDLLDAHLTHTPNY